jgi:hypothetical protein
MAQIYRFACRVRFEQQTAESSKGGQVSKDGFARAAQALAPRIALSFYK